MTTMQPLSCLTGVAQALSMTTACALCLTTRASCSYGARMGPTTVCVLPPASASMPSCGQGGRAPDARQERQGAVHSLLLVALHAVVGAGHDHTFRAGPHGRHKAPRQRRDVHARRHRGVVARQDELCGDGCQRAQDALRAGSQRASACLPSVVAQMSGEFSDL